MRSRQEVGFWVNGDSDLSAKSEAEARKAHAVLKDLATKNSLIIQAPEYQGYVGYVCMQIASKIAKSDNYQDSFRKMERSQWLIKADLALREANRLNPDNGIYLLNLAEIQMHLGYEQNAKEFYRQAHQLRQEGRWHPSHSQKVCLDSAVVYFGFIKSKCPVSCAMM